MVVESYLLQADLDTPLVSLVWDSTAGPSDDSVDYPGFFQVGLLGPCPTSVVSFEFVVDLTPELI